METAAQKQSFPGSGVGWVVAQVPLLVLAFCLPGGVFGHHGLWPMASLAVRRVFGVAFMIGGGVLLAAGVIRLGRSLTALPNPKPDGALVTSGVYRLVRHPMYGGILLLALARALPMASMAALILPAALFLFFDRKAAIEEAMLMEKFPEYGDYRKRAAKLIPWLY